MNGPAVRTFLALDDPAPRVWLHTNTRDGRVALPNYLARGLRPFRMQTLDAIDQPGSETC